MPFVPAVNVIGIELRFLLAGENVENTLYFLSESAPTSGELSTCAGQLRIWWDGEMAELLTTAISLNEIRAVDLTTDSGPAIDFTGGLPSTGVIAEEPPPNNVAACLSFRTEARGRGARGRNYICGFSNSAVFASTLDNTWCAAVVTAYETMQSTLLGEGFTHVVISRFLGSTIVDGRKVPTPRATAVIRPVSTYLFTDRSSDSMKNRLPNH